ncbi:MAG: class C sortase [Propionibacteriaceae bacterium]|jgi:sortase A|nr:class C sortase [Propionibacteriaceae bacterium]
MMKRVVIAIVISLIGSGVLSYPFIANYLAELHGSQAIDSYDAGVNDLSSTDLARVWEEAEAYNRSLAGTPVGDPFIDGTGMAMPDTYWQTMSIAGVMGSIDIPNINVHLPIYHGTGEEALTKGVGHLEGSSLPIGGPSRHSILTGHTGLSSAKLFTDLIELQYGDIFYINVLGETLAYKVDQIKVITPEEVTDLVRIDGKDYVTLLTCTPYGVNSHRLAVRGERIPYDPDEHSEATHTRSSTDQKVLFAALITTGVMLLLIIIVVFFKRRRRKDEEPTTPQTAPAIKTPANRSKSLPRRGI